MKIDIYFKYYPKWFTLSDVKVMTYINLPNLQYFVLDYLKQFDSINLIQCLH